VVEKQEGIQRLILGRSTYTGVSGQAGEELPDLSFPHLCRMALVVEEDERLNPANLGFFSVMAVVSGADCLAIPVKELWLRWRRWRRVDDGRVPTAGPLMRGGLDEPRSIGISHGVLLCHCERLEGARQSRLFLRLLQSRRSFAMTPHSRRLR